MQGRPSCLLQSAGGEANRILLASALSSMRIICPNKVSRRDWIIAVSLGCFVSLRTSSFRTNWYHLLPSSICRHHWSSASILRASVLDIAQQSEPYRNIGKMHVLYSNICCKLTSSSRMRVMNHNWSATKQHLHPQSVADISRHSVLSGDRIRQCGTSSGSRHKDTDQCL